MDSRTTVFLALVCLVATTLGLWRSESAALAVGDPVTPELSPQETDTPKKPAYTYVGSNKCKMCHIKEYKSWAATKMGKSLDILKPGHSKEVKEKFKLDPAKDYTKDKTCLKCHTTGYGHDGGYVIPDPTDKKAVYKAKNLQGVGCESCHGPGSEYLEVFTEIFKSKRKYKLAELYAVGLTRIGKATCTACHNADSPTVSAGDAFDYEKKKDEGTHEHHPLKLREP